jgi:hypothetical protein
VILVRRWGWVALPLAVCGVLLLQALPPSGRERAEVAPAAGVRGLPPLFAGALETLRPDTFRLPPTSEVSIEAAKASAGIHTFRSEPGTAPGTVRAVAAPVAVARLDGETADITGSLPSPAEITRPPRLLDVPAVGVADSVPLAALDTPDLITRGAPGDPGTFPPMIVVDRPFFTVDPVALPQAPLDYVTPGTELMPARAGWKGSRG